MGMQWFALPDYMFFYLLLRNLDILLDRECLNFHLVPSEIPL